MNIDKINDLVKWAEDNKKYDFKGFIVFMNKVDIEKLLLNIFF